MLQVKGCVILYTHGVTKKKKQSSGCLEVAVGLFAASLSFFFEKQTISPILDYSLCWVFMIFDTSFLLNLHKLEDDLH